MDPSHRIGQERGIDPGLPGPLEKGKKVSGLRYQVPTPPTSEQKKRAAPFVSGAGAGETQPKQLETGQGIAYMKPPSLYDAYLDAYSPDRFMAFYASLEEELFLRANPARPIPFSQVPIMLDPSFEALFIESTSLLWTTLSNPIYRELSAENIPALLRPPSRGTPHRFPFDPAHNIGCIDLHLVNGELRMIEFMVLPPGCVGVYPGMLDRYGSYLRKLLPDGKPFCFPRDGTGNAARRSCSSRSLVRPIPSGSLSSIGIPQSQVTYGEFCYTLDMLWRRTPRRDRRPERDHQEGGEDLCQGRTR